MNVQALGPLSVHPDVDEWLISEPVAVPYFDGLLMTFALMGFEDIDESRVESAVSVFLSLTAEDRHADAPDVFRNYRDSIDHYEDDLDLNIDSPGKVWDFVQPTEILVKSGFREETVYVYILAECDWEIEHGLQLIYKDGSKLVKVSGQGEGHP